MMRPGSQKWGYIRIITGTILGGILGFYVMHRLETNYKERMNERLRDYEAELKRTKQERLDEFEESSKVNGMERTAELLLVLSAPVLLFLCLSSIYQPDFCMLVNKLAWDLHKLPAVGGLVQILMSYAGDGDSSN
ncbi:hypothetical protein E2542_SST30953 [Spatholobus suberectus]|nr:hypothetical protein E2542_SST30953 [Spatholobus suberectus]